MKRLVIFDLDGTLLNTIGDLAASCNEVLSRHALPLHTYDEYCNFVGNGITRLVERAIPEELRTEEFIAFVRADFVEYYSAHIDTHTLPYEGINELLDVLPQKGVTMAVASNKFHAGTEKLIKKFFPDTPFVAIYGQRPDVPLKPHPMVVEQILAESGFSAEETLFVGDSAVDMQTARAAGIRGVGCSWGFRSREELLSESPYAIIDHPMQLIELL